MNSASRPHALAYRSAQVEQATLRPRNETRSRLCLISRLLNPLVCERVNDVVDPKLVGLVGGVNGIEWIARPLPVIAHVIVVVHDHHQPASTVFQPIELRRPHAIRRLYI